MATMNEVDRHRCRAQMTRKWAKLLPGDIGKPGLRQMVDLIDDNLDAAIVSLYNKLPAAMKTKITATEFAVIMFAVMARRLGELKAEED